jgi:hypothetical protein
MGSYCQLEVNKYPIQYLKNSYDQSLINLLFSSTDLKIEEQLIRDRNPLVYSEIDVLSNEKEEVIYYKNIAFACLKRLEIFGIDYQASKKDFEYSIDQLMEYDSYTFKKITYEEYLQLIKKIITSKEVKYDGDEYGNVEDYLSINNLAIENQNLENFLFSVLYVIEPNDSVIYDLTDLVHGGWIEIESLNENYDNKKIIVLTEGKTDSEFIKKSIDCLYPELSHCFHFMNFDESKYEASASRLTQTIKAFIGSGIKNKIIALYDNDTAGRKEYDIIMRLSHIPDNIRILQYPDIQLAEKYPTIGPTGENLMNINGLGCSIELYLGKEILTLDNEYIPVHWIAYDESVKAYQCVINKKTDIQNLFRDKVKKFNIDQVNLGYWEEMQRILKTIFTSFVSK